jgi:Predicted small integral membrane protein (DUF2165)
MRIIRLSKAATVAIALFASLVAFGNITDYGTNWAFVQHVLSMDTVYPTATIRYRAIDNPTLQNAGYMLIIAAETLTAILCWVGAARLLLAHGDAAAFNRGQGVRHRRPDARFPRLAGRFHVDRRRVVRDVDVAEVEWRARRLPLPTILMVLIYLVLPDHADEAAATPRTGVPGGVTCEQPDHRPRFRRLRVSLRLTRR